MKITRTGRFKTDGALQDALLSTDAVQAGSTALIEALSEATPVVSGLGAASWSVMDDAHFEGHTLVGKVTNTAENRGYRYIGRANIVSKLHRGFIQRGLQEGKARAISAMRSRIENIKAHLWETKG